MDLLSREQLERRLSDAGICADAILPAVDLAGLRGGGSRFSNVLFNGASLAGSDLSGCAFEKCEFSDTRLDHANLDDCRFSATNLNLATMANSSLQRVHFADCSVMNGSFAAP